MALARSRSFFIHPKTSRHPVVQSNRFAPTLRPQPNSSNPSLNGHIPEKLRANSKDLRKTVVRSTPQAKPTGRLTPTSLALTLPLPPSINHQYATVRGRRVLSSTGRRYKIEIAKFLCSVVTPSPNRQGFLQALESHLLKLSLHFYFPTLLRRDLDGGLKIAQDALCQALGINDNRILEIHLVKSVDSSQSRMECTLSLLNPLPKTRVSRRKSSTSRKP